MATPSPTSVLTFVYRFRLVERNEMREIRVDLDRETLRGLPRERGELPDWTRLEVRKCPNCPLDGATHPRCPAAVAVADVIEAFRDVRSVEMAEVHVIGPERTLVKEAPIQKGVSSLIGLLMATSACPVIGKLRPMVDLHLPFMTHDEAAHRFISNYLTLQFFRMRAGEVPDWSLARLSDLFHEVNVVNRSFCRRLGEARTKDASLNAVVILDVLCNITEFSISKGNLDRLDRIFSTSGA